MISPAVCGFQKRICSRSSGSGSLHMSRQTRSSSAGLRKRAGSSKLQYPPTRGQHLLSRRIYRFTQPPASLAWCVSQEAGCPVCKAQSWQWSGKLVSFLLDVSAAAGWQACGQVAPAPRIPVRAPDRTCKARIDHNIPPHIVHAEPPCRRLARSENREAQFW